MVEEEEEIEDGENDDEADDGDHAYDEGNQ